MITVAIPVGPFEANRRWLAECIESVRYQSLVPNEILIIDDMAGIKPEDVGFIGKIFYKNDCGVTYKDSVSSPSYRIWYSPWRLGVAHAFNFGVALAKNNLVFLMGSDDTLEPNCLEKCFEAWEKNNKQNAYYFTGIRYMDDGELQNLPCGYAMVTKDLWRNTGGFPVESAIGAPDAAFISTLMVHHKGSLVQVAGGAPLVNYRRHNESDTAGRQPWQGAILQTRNILTNSWKKPEWPRYI